MSQSSKAYFSGVDGLRAIAVVAVMLYHHDTAWLPGGFLGVEAFFAISGFIITTLLLKSADSTSRFQYLKFLERRGFRLMPGMLAMTSVSWLVVSILHPEDLTSLAKDTLPALSFSANWWFITGKVSYFEAMQRQPVLKHLWSLAVEFQFYLLWPLLCRQLSRLQRSLAAALTLALAVAAYSWMHHLFVAADMTDPSRVYYGTDTRVGALLVGAALAFAADLLASAMEEYPYIIEPVGFFGIIVLCACIATVSDASSWLYEGGFALSALLTTLCIASVMWSPRGRLARMLSTPWLTKIGLRAYSLYLWHWPVYCLTQPHVDVPYDGVILFVARMVITIALAELSYQTVETPFRSGSVEAAISRILAHSDRSTLRAVGGLTGSVVLAVITALVVLMTRPRVSNSEESVSANGQAELLLRAAVPVTAPALAAVAGPSAHTHDPPQAPQVSKPLALDVSDRTGSGGCPTPRSAPVYQVLRGERYVARIMPGDERKRRFLAVGDSVMLGAANQLFRALGDVDIDSRVGRQLSEGLALIKARKAKHVLSDNVVIHLGNNGPMRKESVAQLITLLRNVPHVFILSLRLPRAYEQSNNEQLQHIAHELHATVIDWRALSLQQDGIMAKDGIHLTRRGAQFYADVLSTAVCTKEPQSVAKSTRQP